MEQEALTVWEQAQWALYGFLTFWGWASVGIMTMVFRQTPNYGD